MDFEVCTDTTEGAIIASEYGAKRVELCAALSEGGLTPSLAMIEQCVESSSAEVFVMIRPSAGGFVYTGQELEIMERDIQAAHGVGAHGVVFGVLNANNEVAVKENMFLMETAMKLGIGTTFHRAIDLCPAPLEALDHIIHLGFDRVLTSGGQPTAPEGLATIQQMAIHAGNKTEIMAGSGINAQNAEQFLTTSVHAIHFTAKKQIDENLLLDMGPKYTVDRDKIAAVSRRINRTMRI